MVGKRLDRINAELARAVAEAIRDLKDPRVSASMVSVTRVEATNDLSLARVYVSALKEGDLPAVLKGLRSAAGYLRRAVGQAVKLRLTPELEFIPDSSISHGARIMEIMRAMEEGDHEDRLQ